MSSDRTQPADSWPERVSRATERFLADLEARVQQLWRNIGQLEEMSGRFAYVMAR